MQPFYANALRLSKPRGPWNWARGARRGRAVTNRIHAGSLSLAVLSFVVAASFAAAQTDPAQTAAFQAKRTSWGDPDLAGIYSNDDETGTPLERPAKFEGLTLKTITPEKIAEIVAERDRRFKAQVDSEAWRRSISPPPHLIFDTFDRNNKRPW